MQEQGSTPLDSRQLIASVQAEVFPYQRNWSRQSDELQQSLQNLDGLWQQLRAGAVVGDMTERLRLREAAAMLATSRWMYRSALQRTETRGMHRRRDHQHQDPEQRHRLIAGGLDEIWVGRLPVKDSLSEEVFA